MNWRKSSYSANNGACVEVVTVGDLGVLVRDSTDPGGTVLALTPDTWRALISSVKTAMESGDVNPVTKNGV